MSEKEVYVIGSAEGPHKIGIATNPRERAKNINTGSPVKVDLIYTTGRIDDTEIIEATAHDLLREKRLNGEWFDVTASQAEEAIRAAIALVQAGKGVRPSRRPDQAHAILLISARQIRAARSLIGWTQEQLATAAGLSLAVVNNVEREATDPRRSTLEKIQRALEGGGVEFLSVHQSSLGGGEGVRLRS